MYNKKKYIYILLLVIFLYYMVKIIYCNNAIFKDFNINTYDKLPNFIMKHGYYNMYNIYHFINNKLYIFNGNNLFIYDMQKQKLEKVIYNLYDKLYPNIKKNDYLFYNNKRIYKNKIYILNNLNQSLDIFELKELKLIKSIKIKNKSYYLSDFIIDNKNNYHIIDRNNMIDKYDANGKYIKSYGEFNNYSYSGFRKIVFLNKKIYILYFINNSNQSYKIKKYDQNGILISEQNFFNKEFLMNKRSLSFYLFNYYVEKINYKYIKKIKLYLRKYYIDQNKTNMIGEFPIGILNDKDFFYLAYQNKIVKYDYKTKKSKNIFSVFEGRLHYKSFIMNYLYDNLKNNDKTLFFWNNWFKYYINKPIRIQYLFKSNKSIFVVIGFNGSYGIKHLIYKMDFNGNNRKILKLKIPKKYFEFKTFHIPFYKSSLKKYKDIIKFNFDFLKMKIYNFLYG